MIDPRNVLLELEAELVRLSLELSTVRIKYLEASVVVRQNVELDMERIAGRVKALAHKISVWRA